MSDAELVLRVCDGDDAAFAALAGRHTGMLRNITSRYFLTGADRDDLDQEALIGLHKACLSFDFSGRAQFRHFAALCVERHILTAVKAHTRGKHRALNESIRFSMPLGETGATVGDTLASTAPGPERIVQARTDLGALLGLSLSDTERAVLGRHLSGMSLADSGAGLGKSGQGPAKVADNALQRVRKKAGLVLAA